MIVIAMKSSYGIVFIFNMFFISNPFLCIISYFLLEFQRDLRLLSCEFSISLVDVFLAEIISAEFCLRNYIEH